MTFGITKVESIVQKYGFNHGCCSGHKTAVTANTEDSGVNVAYTSVAVKSKTFYSHDTVMWPCFCFTSHSRKLCKIQQWGAVCERFLVLMMRAVGKLCVSLEVWRQHYVQIADLTVIVADEIYFRRFCNKAKHVILGVVFLVA